MHNLFLVYWRNVLRISCASSWVFFALLQVYRDARSTKYKMYQRSSHRNDFREFFFLGGGGTLHEFLSIKFRFVYNRTKITGALHEDQHKFLLRITNNMQRYTIFFIIVNALRVSGGFSAHHQELKNCTHSIWYMSSLLAATASASSKQAWHIPDSVCTVLELLVMGAETAWNT